MMPKIPEALGFLSRAMAELTPHLPDGEAKTAMICSSALLSIQREWGVFATQLEADIAILRDLLARAGQPDTEPVESDLDARRDSLLARLIDVHAELEIRDNSDSPLLDDVWKFLVARNARELPEDRPW